MSVKLIDNKNHIVIKRDGREEPFSATKLYQVILWACANSEVLANELLEATTIKIYNKIHITKLYDEVINTASNLISDMFPVWESVAKKLYILKLHKELGVKRAKYPEYEDIIKLNIANGFYAESLLSTVDIQTLSAVINQDYDELFTFGGLNLFVQKYCNRSKSQLLELPQHVYMRIAIQLMHTEGTEAIIAKYHQLANHEVTEATPKTVNSSRPNPQLFSCCLAKPDDSLESINIVDDLLGRESKFGGGLASDESAIRAPGAVVEGNKGRSSGAIPFIQGTQWSVGKYNQGSTRSAAMAMYYNWFHYQSPEITKLKLESGKDEDRARKLKYAVKWTKQLTDAIKSDSDVYLFDPHKTQDMTYAYGQELVDLYNKYSKNTSIHKRKYRARDLAYTLAEVKAETGNNYTFFTDNANIQNIGGAPVTQSNLCMEYMPNFEPIRHIEDTLINGKMVRTYDGDIALCNLSSINLMKWILKSPEEKFESMLLLVTSMDNAIDQSFYANPLGKKHSENHRNLGIGVSNYANWLASNQWTWDNPNSRQAIHELFEEIQFYAIKSSIELAKVRSRFPLFHKSKWAQGIFPHELSILSTLDRPDLNYPLKMDWESLRPDLLKYGIRNEYLMAVAPTATSGQCINATPGVDAPRKLKTIVEGTYSLPFVVPNLNKNRDYYQTLFNISNKDVIEHAAIRQKFICMGQSVSLAYPKPDSAYEIISDIMYAEELGLKSLYYTYTPIEGEDLSDEECEACGS